MWASILSTPDCPVLEKKINETQIKISGLNCRQKEWNARRPEAEDHHTLNISRFQPFSYG